VNTYQDKDLIDEYGPPAGARYTVAVYLCHRAYGGPEEGGWWYNAGEREDDYPVRHFALEADAVTYRDEVEVQTRADLPVRRSHSYWTEAVLFDGDTAPQYIPDTVPHYE
jgi:hypothetical protein